MQIFQKRTFTVWQIALIKMTLIPFGIILGLYFYESLLPFMQLWWVLFVIGSAYFIGQFVRGN
ncbi:hypothetical protein HQ487_01055 [Candidatus Uhrbacteria bacterium]|nr:hypothetical protein [Candidatus Uhrbacteria bacterium]